MVALKTELSIGVGIEAIKAASVGVLAVQLVGTSEA